jgi:hypothetical protein
MGGQPGEPRVAAGAFMTHDEEDDQGAPRLKQLRAAALDTDALDDIPEPEPLVTGLLYTDTTAWTIGKAGHCKSFLALDMAGCIGTGTDWQDHGVIQGPVLYVIAEGAAGIRKRVRAWEKSYGRKMTGVTFLPVAVQAGRPADWTALIELAQELGAVLVILDTQARCTVGMEENSARDMGEFIHQLEKLRIATRACVMVVHHKGRSGDHMRGSTAMDGAGDTVLEAVKDGEVVTVKNQKQKHVEQHEDILLRLSPIGESAVLVLTDGKDKGSHSAARVTARRWWDLFGGELVSATKAIDAEVAKRPTFHRHVAELVRDGLVVKEESGIRVYYRMVGPPGGET